MIIFVRSLKYFTIELPTRLSGTQCLSETEREKKTSIFECNGFILVNNHTITVSLKSSEHTQKPI